MILEQRMILFLIDILSGHNNYKNNYIKQISYIANFICTALFGIEVYKSPLTNKQKPIEDKAQGHQD